MFFEPHYVQEERPRFTKTKNLLRNLSNYMHKFILYNKRAEVWVRQYFRRKLAKFKRKPSLSASLSNKSELHNYSPPCKEIKEREAKDNSLSIEEEEKPPVKIEEEEDG